MGFVDDAQPILREIVEQACGPFPGQPIAEQPRVVLDAGTPPHFHQHVDIEVRAGLQALGLQQLVLRPQLCQPFGQLRPDTRHGALDCGALRDKVRGGIDR